jgi:hypothetical protein
VKLNKIIACFLAIWMLPAHAYDPNVAPAVNGLQLDDDYNQIVSTLGSGEILPMEPGVFSLIYGSSGLAMILSEQSGVSKIEQIESSSTAHSILGVSVGNSKEDIERLVGTLTVSGMDATNTASLYGKGWIVHFIFDDQNILQRFALVKLK